MCSYFRYPSLYPWHQGSYCNFSFLEALLSTLLLWQMFVTYQLVISDIIIWCLTFSLKVFSALVKMTWLMLYTINYLTLSEIFTTIKMTFFWVMSLCIVYHLPPLIMLGWKSTNTMLIIFSYSNIVIMLKIVNKSSGMMKYLRPFDSLSTLIK